MPTEHRGHARMAAEALHEAAMARYAADKQVAINLAQVHATLEVAHQLELIRTQGIRKKGMFDDVHYCKGRDTNLATSGTEADCGWCKARKAAEDLPPSAALYHTSRRDPGMQHPGPIESCEACGDLTT